MIDLDKIGDVPVLILSSPRTGSTVLANFISDNTHRRFFNEPAQSTKSLHMFLLHDENHKDYVLKEHTLLFLKRYPEKFINQSLYKIRIRRKNIFEQVLSNYIAVNRKQFIFHKGTELTDVIKLDENYLCESLEFIKNYNRETDLFRYDIDLDLYYEDLNITESETIPTPRPLNYEELNKWAYDILKDRL